LRTARQVAGRTAIVLIALLSACSSGADQTPTVSTSAAPADKELPIAGLAAADLLAQAQAALPGSSREDFIEGAPGYTSITKSAIGFPVQDGGTPNGSTPGIEISWVDDGTVIFVACADLTGAGTSPTIEFCTNLDVTGVPAGGLDSVWRQFTAGTWDHSQPFPQVTISAFPYDAMGPQVGPAQSFAISGPNQGSVTVTGSSSL